MKRFLDIMIVFLLSILFFSLFFNNNKEKAPKETLEIVFEKNKYTIPASVKVLIENYTQTGFVINACEDINLLKSGELMNFTGSICENIMVEPGTTHVISYEENYSDFNQTGKYTLEVNIEDKKYLDQFELNNRGIIARTFIGLIYTPIYNLVIFLIELFGGSLGWAIVGIAIILKLVLLYPQQKMMISQRKIQEIQPKIKQIQEQYKGNQAQIGQKLMELYSKEKINPMGSCGFLLIQMPILLVVYNVIRGIQSPSNGYYLYSYFGDFAIANINYNFLGLDLLGQGGVQGIILAITVALIQFIQIKVSLVGKSKDNSKEIVLEKKEDKNDYSKIMPDADMMNKFMLYGMPIMVGVITYTWFAAIGLYWGISTFLTLIQNLIVNKEFKK